MIYNAEIEDRFLIKVAKTDGCWEWTGARSSNGYGAFGVNGGVKRAHRVAYELFVGPIPEGMCVCHHCDNRECVNPTHLFLGTNSDNMKDSFSKGRCHPPVLRGESHGRAKLTVTQVEEIRKMYSTGDYSQRELAKQFGICNTNITPIVRGDHWKQ